MMTNMTLSTQCKDTQDAVLHTAYARNEDLVTKSKNVALTILVLTKRH